MAECDQASDTSIPPVSAEEKGIIPKSSNWSEILRNCREDRDGLPRQAPNYDGEGVASVDHELFCEKYRAYFPLVAQQLSSYCDYQFERRQYDSCDLVSSSTKREQKRLIVNTRNAIRFSTACFVVDSVRRTMQAAALRCGWAELICRVICLRRELSFDDDICRLYASRLLSNMVTSNAETAAIVMSSVALRPSDETISRRIVDGSAVLYENDDGELPFGVLDQQRNVVDEPNWLDMILCTARHREALAAVIAALHNALASLSGGDIKDCRNKVHQDSSSFAHQVSSDSLFMSTLLRQVISVDFAEKSVHEGRGRVDTADDATDWIVLLIRRLSQVGHLATMYRTIAGTGSEKILPEQLILLHCVLEAIRTSEPCLSAETTTELALFLIDLYLKLRMESATLEESGDALCDQATLTVLDTLAEIVGSTATTTSSTSVARASHQCTVASLRLKIGQETSFVQHIGKRAGRILDEVMQSHQQGKKVLPGDNSFGNDKGCGPMLIVLVRLLGYLSFRCRANQDLVRTTKVPQVSGDSSAAISAGSPSPDERTVLHVLLSCTALSFVCFPLREWSIVSLRLVLQDNEENQAAVASLQAHRAAQTHALDEMGMKIELDHDGKIKLSPK